ncbi:hypothetical protein RhiirA1_387897 [Rhizophagus irregularis]|uniref:C2H2-type domain-containing protein n=1 Tax=Rhizophagus irregularis TaxID=588596 RepID=A0A2N0SGN6_9GLOM|nr:hypothetical protein RhiirA1_387897 [Rhizophagus irregularis]
MFNCPYQNCKRTFSRHAALREHTKSHKGQAYWEILNSVLEDSCIEKVECSRELVITDNVDEREYNVDNDHNVDDDNNAIMEIVNEDVVNENIADESVVDKSVIDENIMDRGIMNESDSDTDFETSETIIDIEEEPVYDHIHNYTLYTPEQTDKISLIDTRSISSRNIPQFPDAAYSEFMELISTHNLSNSAGNDILKWFRKHHLRDDIILPTNTVQGREFVSSMDIKHLLYLKTKILKYEDEEYFLYHRPIFEAIKELLSNIDIINNCQWNCSPDYITNENGHRERVYGEQWSGMWWENAQKSIGTGLKKVLSIILYSDATTLDHFGKSSEHPVYLSLGNIPNWRKNKRDAKVLLGILPKLKPLHNRKENKSEFASAKRMLYQYCFDIMTKPIYECDGLDIKTDNQIIWAFPFLSEFIGDLPEDASLTLTYSSSRSSHPCHICTVTIDELNNINLSKSQIELRTPNNMQVVINNNLCHEYSIHPMRNIFWKFPELNIYSAAVPDRMHHCDLGLFNYQVNFARNYIQLYCGKDGIDEFDKRLAKIPRFPELKIFKSGLGNIARFTAAEFRNMMKQLVFVIDGLIVAKRKSNLSLFQAKQHDSKLVDLFVSWNRMYIFSRKDTFTDSELDNFQKMIIDWANKFINLFTPIADTEMKYPKLHNWQHHIIDAIRNYGAINGFTTETYESLHKFYIKAPYRMSNRRDATSQIINLVRHDSILNYLQKITSPPSIKKHRQIRTLGGIEGSFTLDTFNDFVDEYRTTHFLALEAEKAFEVLIDSLNQYFDLIENITDKDVEATIIKWYTSAFIREVDTIRAKSNYYNAPAFSDIAINMNEEEAEKYNTIDGVCFAKILMLFGLKIPGHDEQELALVHWGFVSL